jgi:hypothetical protein
MPLRTSSLSVIAGMLLTASVTSAQEHIIRTANPEPGWRPVAPGTFSPLDPFHASLGVGAGGGWFRAEPARLGNVGTAGVMFWSSIDADILDLLNLGVALDSIGLEDKGQFKQDVIEAGEVHTEESTLGVLVLSVWGGLRTPDFCLALGQFPGGTGWLAVHAFARVGYGWVSAGRGIKRCIDCKNEDVHLNDGAFLEPGLSVNFKITDSWGFSLVNSYRRFSASADIVDEYRGGFAISYW